MVTASESFSREGPADWRRQLAAVCPPVERSATLPPACYSETAVFAEEQRKLFAAGWVGVGRGDRWKRAGDFAALEIGGAPLVVLRDRQGALRAYGNSCRHRGAKLLEGEGNCKVISCPFHRWAYGLDGQLRTAPDMENTPDFDKSDYGLIEVPCAEREGFAFVNLDGAAGALEDWLGDFAALHAPWSMTDLVSTRRREFDVACNWKAFLEVFNEYYHLPYVHPNSFGPIYGAPDPTDPVTGQYTTQFGGIAASASVLEEGRDALLPGIPTLEGRNRQGVRYTWVYPNMTFAAASDAMWVYEVLPLAPDRTRVGMTACFSSAATALPDFEEKAAHYYHRLDVGIAEDIPVLEKQQAGLTSPLARQGRFSSLEPSVGNFACWYAERMRESG